MWNSNICSSHFYIHWPFCKNKCDYCDFLSFPKCDGLKKKYHDALLNEILSFSQSLDSKVDRKISTLFFGGGTPSLYPLDLLREFFTTLRSNFDLSNLKEATIEVNPGGVAEEQLKMWKSLGLNRLSIGVQVLDDAALRLVNRHQTQKDFFGLMAIAPKYFDNISVDLILGLPSVSEETWINTLKSVVKLPINHISVYLLTLYDKTVLRRKVDKGEVDILDDDKLSDLYQQSVLYLEENGFNQYEISNFAKTGFESKHNKAYWDCKSYRSFGLGASSFDGQGRFVNIKDLKKYLMVFGENPLNIDNPYSYFESLSTSQKFLEEMMLGLRQKKGVGLHRVLYFLSGESRTAFFEKLDRLKKKDLIIEERGRIALTLKGMLMENEVILNLF